MVRVLTLIFLIAGFASAKDTKPGYAGCWPKDKLPPQSMLDGLDRQHRRIERFSDSTDVDSQMTAYLDTLAAMNCDEKVLIRLKKGGQEVVDLSRKNELDYLKKNVRFYSDFRSPGPELERMKVLAKLTGQDLDNVISAKDRAQLLKDGIAASLARKSTCTPKDNRTPSLEHIRDQRDAGWCYAFTAADMLSQKTGDVVSAAGLAVAFADRYRFSIRRGRNFLFKKESERNGGDVGDAIVRAQKKGYCLESEVPSGEFEIIPDKGYKFAMEQLEKIRANYKLLERQNGSEKAKQQEAACLETERNSFEEMFPTLQADEILKGIETGKKRRFIKELVDEACKTPKTLPKGLYFDDYFVDILTTGPHEPVQTIDQALNEGTIVGLEYDSEYLENTHHYRAKAGHASSIVARKFNDATGSCEYLIRNSWGESCAGYDPSLKCENGQIWMPEATVIQSAEYLITLQSKP